MKDNPPIDKSEKGTEDAPLAYTSPTCIGGDNSACWTDSMWVEIHGGDLGPPFGVPGDSDHPLALRRCSKFKVIGTRIHASGHLASGVVKTKSGDGVNLFNCSGCELVALTFDGMHWNGHDNAQHDVAHPFVIDGDGDGTKSNGIVVKDSHIPWMVVAAGGDHTLDNLALARLDFGGGYPGDLSREPHINATLIAVRTSALYIHPACGPIKYDSDCKFGSIDDKGHRLTKI